MNDFIQSTLYSKANPSEAYERSGFRADWRRTSLSGRVAGRHRRSAGVTGDALLRVGGPPGLNMSLWVTIPTPALLAKVVDLIDDVPMEKRDTKGDLYEYMLGKIATAGQNGQFRTPRHIIQPMVRAFSGQLKSY